MKTIKIGNQKAILIGDDHNGVEIIINKSKRSLDIFGWYNSFVGLCESEEIKLDDLLELFKPSKKSKNTKS